MSATEYKVDKTNWPDGPWKTEPDRLQWVHAGLDCLMVRQSRHGAWCGYVGVPNDHPAYGKDFESVEVDVHGGLTYGAKCRSHICHVPEPGQPDDVWWLGFDCAHAFDVSPGYMFPPFEGDVYRDVEYVKGECERLAEQLAATLANPPSPE